MKLFKLGYLFYDLRSEAINRLTTNRRTLKIRAFSKVALFVGAQFIVHYVSPVFVTLLILVHYSSAENLGILEPSAEIIETGLDNRSLAMGKTPTTTSRSGSAIFSNPSMLGTFAKSQVQVGGKFLYGTITNEAALDDNTYALYEAKYPIFPNRSYLAVAIPYRLQHRHLPRPRNWQIVFGIGYQRNEGVKGEIQALWSEDGKAALKGKSASIRGRRWGALSTITPGVALNLGDRYFFGLAFNRTLGAINYTNELEGPGRQTQVDSEQEQSALFLRMGALAKVTPELSIGLMYRPSFDWELGRTTTKTYVDGELETDRDQMAAQLTIPTVWGLGAEYKVSPDFVVALEVQSRPFSELQWSGDVQQHVFVENGFNFSVGAEYLGAPSAFRFGAFRDVIPFVDEDDTAPVNLVGFTAGIGSDAEADFSWNASVLFGTWGHFNNKGQEYSENLIRAGISATYRFKTHAGSSSTN